MKIVEINNWIVKINLEDDKLHDIPNDIIDKYIGIIIDNHQIKYDDYVNYALSFGNFLDYNGGPVYSFDGSSAEPVEYHTDGVSSPDINKVPKYVLFYVERWPVNDGAFSLCNIEILFSKLDKYIQNIFRNEKLEFYNYYPDQYNSSEDLFSFSIDPLRIIDGNEYLRLFVPIEDSLLDQVKWKYKMKFSNKSFEESKKILVRLRDLSRSEDCQIDIQFKKNDILIIHNNKVFHKRHEFKNVDKNRILHRIQILDN